jgi:hypothetical protein
MSQIEYNYLMGWLSWKSEMEEEAYNKARRK